MVEDIKKENADVKRITRLLKGLKQEMADVKKNQAQIKNDLKELKTKEGVNQPSNKIKVAEHRTDDQGRLKYVPACDCIATIKKQVEKRGGLETRKISRIIEKHNHDISRKQVHNKMDRMAEVWEHLEVQSAKERRKSKSNRLISTDKIN